LILIHEKFSWQKYYKLLVVQNFLTKIYSIARVNESFVSTYTISGRLMGNCCWNVRNSLSLYYIGDKKESSRSFCIRSVQKWIFLRVEK